jgi:hypothetical protein
MFAGAWHYMGMDKLKSAEEGVELSMLKQEKDSDDEDDPDLAVTD